MLKLLLAAAPYLLKAPKSAPRRSIGGALVGALLICVAAIFLLVALFLVVQTNLGPEMACLTIGAILLIAGLVFWMSSRAKLPAKAIDPEAAALAKTQQDPIAGLLPDGFKDSPAVKKIMTQMAENPIAASAAALSLGLIISHEIFKDK